VILQPSPLAAGAVPDHLELFILIISGTERDLFINPVRKKMLSMRRQSQPWQKSKTDGEKVSEKEEGLFKK
jgi:hypothetical protein